jgi:hypothetical protein
MVNKQHHHGADDGDEEAVQIQLRYADRAKDVEQPASDDRSYDSEQDIQYHSLATMIDQVASDESSYESE